MARVFGGGSEEMGTAGFGSVLGMLGAAVSPPGTWQSRVGQVAAMMGQGKMTGLQREKSLAKREDMWAQLIKDLGGGEGMTEKGMAGPTSFTRAGDEISIKGDIEPLVSGAKPEITDLAREVAGPGLDMKDLIPF
jgi:hypothetical protein